MVLCLLALPVFAFLAIFSVRYRKLTKDALECLFKTVTLRKCSSGLDDRIKADLTGRAMRLSPKLAGKIYKHYKVISWIILAVFLWSTVQTAIGGYNFYLYGNCNGLQDSGFCIFDPLGENSKFSLPGTEDGTCPAEAPSPKYLTLANVDLSLFPHYDRNAENDVLFIGCYACPYTRSDYSNIRKLLERDDVNFIFAHFPVKETADYISNIINCVYSLDKQAFIRLNDEMFKRDPSLLKDKEAILDLVEEIGVDKEIIRECSISDKTAELNDLQFEELMKIGVYGTPTVFVNGVASVGPKPYRVYKRMLK